MEPSLTIRLDLIFLLLAYLVPFMLFLVLLGSIADLAVRLLRKGRLPGECGEPCGHGKRCSKHWWHQGEHQP